MVGVKNNPHAGRTQATNVPLQQELGRVLESRKVAGADPTHASTPAANTKIRTGDELKSITQRLGKFFQRIAAEFTTKVSNLIKAGRQYFQRSSESQTENPDEPIFDTVPDQSRFRSQFDSRDGKIYARIQIDPKARAENESSVPAPELIYSELQPQSDGLVYQDLSEYAKAGVLGSKSEQIDSPTYAQIEVDPDALAENKSSVSAQEVIYSKLQPQSQSDGPVYENISKYANEGAFTDRSEKKAQRNQDSNISPSGPTRRLNAIKEGRRNVAAG